MIRSRWAAIGAAVAVALGGGGLAFVDAAGGEPSTFVAIEPCRLLDTRPEYAIGGRSTPLGPGEQLYVNVDVLESHLSFTECAGSILTTGVRALSLNVTAVRATKQTYVTVWPGGPVPNVSSLNPAPGQPPTPNAVTTALAADRSFRVYNHAGEVHLVIDVVGYYVPDPSVVVAAAFTPTTELDTGFVWPAGTEEAAAAWLGEPIQVVAPSRLIVTGAVTVSASSESDEYNVVSCRLAHYPSYADPEWIGTWQVAEVYSAPGLPGVANIGLTSGVDVDAGTHDLSVRCVREFADPPMAWIADGDITVVIVPR